MTRGKHAVLVSTLQQIVQLTREPGPQGRPPVAVALALQSQNKSAKVRYLTECRATQPALLLDY